MVTNVVYHHSLNIKNVKKKCIDGNYKSRIMLSKINKEAADLALQMCFRMATNILEELSQKEIQLTVEENSNPDDNILDKSMLLQSK
ncbi:hypothetical protein llap_6086 [Limosa lapponica baueri]|uniref:Uncharacterized protein n=1 Tax=Limosa lapponica baueri TaxID=1758121 RepID=A0A2I0UC18_LIMLA|nr:hypothetical protein llap_6086 [Limosa lapponica baueri]